MPAFSMLELIFVIVILGIVASIGSELIVKVYESYIVQRAQHRASIKTELAATQIANRLASAIPGTIFRRTMSSGGTIENVNDYRSLPSDSYKVLQWVGADTEGFNFYDNSTKKIGWSGFCDINVSTKHSIKTPGSQLDFEDTLQTNFGYTNKFAIYFPYDPKPYYGVRSGTETILLDNNASHIVEHYKLAWTSYALVCENGGTNFCGDLTLYYNFIPTPAIDINSTTASKSVLLKNVTTFKFKGAGRTIRFKICKEERISEDVNITACKEKAVF
jgi:prepilin-type N-terminal cleavage/methylation domain-containing protein